MPITDTKIKLTPKAYKDYTGLTYEIQYGKTTTTFDNMSYFEINVNSEAYQNITKILGGFYANMTCRKLNEIQKKYQKTVTSILLCNVTADCLLLFLYLDETGTVVEHNTDNAPADYACFRDKFSKAVAKEGVVYDLLDKPNLKLLNDYLARHSEPNFGLLNDSIIEPDTILFCQDFSLLRESLQNKLKQLNADHMEFQFTYGACQGFYLTGIICTASGESIKTYQIESGLTSYEDYQQSMPPESPLCDEQEIFHINIPSTLAAHYTQLFSIFDRKEMKS